MLNTFSINMEKDSIDDFRESTSQVSTMALEQNFKKEYNHIAIHTKFNGFSVFMKLVFPSFINPNNYTSIQWLLNGSPIPNATRDIYLIPSYTDPQYNGKYTVLLNGLPISDSFNWVALFVEIDFSKPGYLIARGFGGYENHGKYKYEWITPFGSVKSKKVKILHHKNVLFGKYVMKITDSNHISVKDDVNINPEFLTIRLHNDKKLYYNKSRIALQNGLHLAMNVHDMQGEVTLKNGKTDIKWYRGRKLISEKPYCLIKKAGFYSIVFKDENNNDAFFEFEVYKDDFFSMMNINIETLIVGGVLLYILRLIY